MAVIEPDVRMSNFWGLLKGAGASASRRCKTQPAATVAPGRAGQCLRHQFCRRT